MQQYRIITGITDTLGGLLRKACSDAGYRRVEITHDIPKAEKIKARPAIVCYMNHIGFAPHYRERNQTLVTTHDDGGKIVSYYLDSPLYLTAHYLTCVFGNSAREENLLMGLVMKTFLEHPMITGDLLLGDCFHPDDQLNVHPKTDVEYEEVLSFWRSLNEEVRPTVFYSIKFALVSERMSDTVSDVTEPVVRT